MTHAIKIGTDGTIERIEVELEYPGLNKIFGGGLIELVHSQRLTDRFAGMVAPIMVVDEEGRIKDLPLNEMASRLYAPKVYRDRFYIAGDALIIGEGMTSEGADLMALPEVVTIEALTELLAMFEDH